MRWILLIEDHEVVRRGPRRILAEALPEADYGEASNSREAVDQLAE